jgi:hypothetical protein
VSREYVAALENRIALLESFISGLKSVPECEKIRMVDEISFTDHLAGKSVATTPPNLARAEPLDMEFRTRWKDLGNGKTALYQLTSLG